MSSPPVKALRLTNRSALRISGGDAERFLQGLITNDITKTAPNKALYAALLTPQGKYLFDFFILRRDGGFLFDVEAAQKDALIRKLTFYRIRADVAIEDASSGYDIWAFDAGPEPSPAGACLFQDPRLAALGWRGFVKGGAAFAENWTFEEYEELRLSLGVPDASRDIEVDRRFILEANFKELNGVDFNKGCYVGQEMTARMTYRGSLKKRLLPATVEGPLPAPGTPFFVAGREAGHVLSGHGRHAMTLTRLEFLGSGPFETEGAATITVFVPEWLKLD